jgi:hypothetical protein
VVPEGLASQETIVFFRGLDPDVAAQAITVARLWWLDPNAIQLCGALEEVDLGWAVVGDVAVGGAFGSLVFQSAAFDGAGAAAMSTGRVESLDDFTDRGLDRPGESAGGKTPPGR